MMMVMINTNSIAKIFSELLVTAVQETFCVLWNPKLHSWSLCNIS